MSSSSGAALRQMLVALDKAVEASDTAAKKLQMCVENLRVHASRQPDACYRSETYIPLMKCVYDPERAAQQAYVRETAKSALQIIRDGRAAKKKRASEPKKAKRTSAAADPIEEKFTFSARLKQLEELIEAPKLDVAKAKPVLRGIWAAKVSAEDIRKCDAMHIVGALDAHPNDKIRKAANKIIKSLNDELRLDKLRQRPEKETEAEQMARLSKKARLIEEKHERERKSKRAREIGMKQMERIKKQKVVLHFGRR